jgi:hypothetical protein
MTEIRAVLFWMTGVVTQSVPAVAMQLAQAAGRSPANLTALPEFNLAQEHFALGRLGDLDFCQRLSQFIGLDWEPAALRQKMLAAFVPEQPTLEIIQALPAALERWLIVDLPPAWYEALAGTLRLQTCFAPERLIFLGQSDLPRLVPDVYYYLSRRLHLEAGRGLVIDPLLRRAMEGINHMFPAAHYVNSRLLKQEFYLRRFTGRTTLNHKPDQVA